MADFKIPEPNTICWRELATRDLPAATEFYSKLFGWDLQQSKITPMEYKEIHMDDKAIGGMMAIDESWGPEPPPSFWNAYVAVENADESAEKIKANGGNIMHGPFDAPGVGRMAMVKDPAGAAFAIIQFTQPA
jgi:predicted enzyme related to lactoylglutathione lyase